MNDLIFEVVKLVVMLVVTGVCAYAMPYLKFKIGMDKLDRLAFWSNQFVLTAQQVMWAKSGEERKAYVKEAMKDIAKEANITVALIYLYFKNKEELFDSIVGSVYLNFSSAFDEEESLKNGSAYDRFDQVGEKYIHNLLQNRKKLIILMDKSSGTKHESAKQKLISQMEMHIRKGLKRQSNEKYDKMLAHILANNFTEGLLEIARHYENEEWAKHMLRLMAKCYYTGVESL